MKNMQEAADDFMLRLKQFPRCILAHAPTPLESMPRLSQTIDGKASLFVKRDDCTGLAFGGNKIRQLEYYFGRAMAERADTVLITGAVQSNFVRATAAAAARQGMACHIQLEERVPDVSRLHRSNGNVLLDRLLGATLHSFPLGEDEAGADANLAKLAEDLEQQGARPYVIPLGPDHDPLGALGYIDAAAELLQQLEHKNLKLDHIVVASGSGSTHAGLLFGLRALGDSTSVLGVCPRRNAQAQAMRIAGHLEKLGRMLGRQLDLAERDIQLYDATLAPGYGQLNQATRRAIALAAECEGLLLDPVYTGKVLAGLLQLVQDGELEGNIAFWHTGGQPALFAYDDLATPPNA